MDQFELGHRQTVFTRSKIKAQYEITFDFNRLNGIKDPVNTIYVTLKDPMIHKSYSFQ